MADIFDLFKKIETPRGPVATGPVEWILACLGRLGQRDRDLLTLVCSLGYSYKETSEITGMTVSNVGSALKRAKERLRKELENEGII